MTLAGSGWPKTPASGMELLDRMWTCGPCWFILINFPGGQQQVAITPGHWRLLGPLRGPRLTGEPFGTVVWRATSLFTHEMKDVADDGFIFMDSSHRGSKRVIDHPQEGAPGSFWPACGKQLD